MFCIFVSMDLFGASGFEWDEGNSLKNWLKHLVSMPECEEVFRNKPLLLLPDTKHSEGEERWIALGKTNLERKLFLSFTVRDDRIRIISARSMSRREREQYEEA